MEFNHPEHPPDSITWENEPVTPTLSEPISALQVLDLTKLYHSIQNRRGDVVGFAKGDSGQQVIPSQSDAQSVTGETVRSHREFMLRQTIEDVASVRSVNLVSDADDVVELAKYSGKRPSMNPNAPIVQSLETLFDTKAETHAIRQLLQAAAIRANPSGAETLATPGLPTVSRASSRMSLASPTASRPGSPAFVHRPSTPGVLIDRDSDARVRRIVAQFRRGWNQRQRLNEARGKAQAAMLNLQAAQQHLVECEAEWERLHDLSENISVTGGLHEVDVASAFGTALHDAEIALQNARQLVQRAEDEERAAKRGLEAVLFLEMVNYENEGGASGGSTLLAQTLSEPSKAAKRFEKTKMDLAQDIVDFRRRVGLPSHLATLPKHVQRVLLGKTDSLSKSSSPLRDRPPSSSSCGDLNQDGGGSQTDDKGFVSYTEGRIGQYRLVIPVRRPHFPLGSPGERAILIDWMERQGLPESVKKQILAQGPASQTLRALETNSSDVLSQVDSWTYTPGSLVAATLERDAGRRIERARAIAEHRKKMMLRTWSNSAAATRVAATARNAQHDLAQILEHPGVTVEPTEADILRIPVVGGVGQGSRFRKLPSHRYCVSDEAAIVLAPLIRAADDAAQERATRGYMPRPPPKALPYLSNSIPGPFGGTGVNPRPPDSLRLQTNLDHNILTGLSVSGVQSVLEPLSSDQQSRALMAKSTESTKSGGNADHAEINDFMITPQIKVKASPERPLRPGSPRERSPRKAVDVVARRLREAAALDSELERLILKPKIQSQEEVNAPTSPQLKDSQPLHAMDRTFVSQTIGLGRDAPVSVALAAKFRNEYEALRTVHQEPDPKTAHNQPNLERSHRTIGSSSPEGKQKKSHTRSVSLGRFAHSKLHSYDGASHRELADIPQLAALTPGQGVRELTRGSLSALSKDRLNHPHRKSISVERSHEDEPNHPPGAMTASIVSGLATANKMADTSTSLGSEVPSTPFVVPEAISHATVVQTARTSFSLCSLDGLTQTQGQTHPPGQTAKPEGGGRDSSAEPMRGSVTGSGLLTQELYDYVQEQSKYIQEMEEREQEQRQQLAISRKSLYQGGWLSNPQLAKLRSLRERGIAPTVNPESKSNASLSKPQPTIDYKHRVQQSIKEAEAAWQQQLWLGRVEHDLERRTQQINSQLYGSGSTER